MGRSDRRTPRHGRSGYGGGGGRLVASIEHVYTGDGGKRGGAVHRITEHYAKIIRLYSAGKTAKVAGDTTTAAAKFREASYNLGMLAHFYGDVLQPYHTSRDAIGMDSQHHAYELLVNSLTKTPTSSSSWSVANTGWTVKDMTNVRTAAISAAAYSRARYTTLAANFSTNDDSLSSAAKAVTRRSSSAPQATLRTWSPRLRRASNPPKVGSMKIWMKWRGVKANESVEAAFGTVRHLPASRSKASRSMDVPLDDGSKKALRFWTDGLGTGHITYPTGTTPLMAKQTVSYKVTTDQTSVTKATWFYQTKRLADGSTGFKTTVSDLTVVGQTVTVTSTVRTTTGDPIAGLHVVWTWTMGSTTKTTSGYTDSTGKAKSSFTVLSTTTRSEIHVHGGTPAYSINRNSNAYFHRVDWTIGRSP